LREKQVFFCGGQLEGRFLKIRKLKTKMISAAICWFSGFIERNTNFFLDEKIFEKEKQHDIYHAAFFFIHVY